MEEILGIILGSYCVGIYKGVALETIKRSSQTKYGRYLEKSSKINPVSLGEIPETANENYPNKPEKQLEN